MENNQNSAITPEWKGGFAESDPKFAYPNPDLSSLPMLDNMANIDLLQRQQAVKWPEFSWETVPGEPESRCYRMFAPYISRLGYTNEGRVYSIICPQQGIVSPSLGSMNVEVTVTGQRGWVNEANKEVAADLSVEAKIWFAPSAQQKKIVKKLWDKFANSKLPFPSNKADAIRILTHKVNEPKQPAFPLKIGETKDFDIPDFARHTDEAWNVGNLSVQIGSIVKVRGHGLKNIVVNKFNKLIVGFFNKSAGNMLKTGNVLTWNVWFTAPELVDQAEWRNHAKLWRDSIQADHGSPEGEEGTPVRYFDGTPFKAGELYPGASTTRGFDVFSKSIEELEEEELADLESFLAENF